MDWGQLNLIAPLDDVRNRFRHHADAVDDRTHGQAQIASRTVVGDVGQMGFGIELDGLVAGVGTRHIAFTAIDAEILFWNEI